MFQRSFQRIIVGTAVVIAAATIVPIARETLKPIIGQLSRQMKFYIVSAKEGIEDLVAEVKFERMKKFIDQDRTMVIDYKEFIEEQNEKVTQLLEQGVMNVTEQNREVIQQLRQAMAHLDNALNISLRTVKEDPDSKKLIGEIWEEFLGSFIGRVRSKGKESNINIMGFFPLLKIRKFL
jgi:hypothetical protein